MTPGGGRFLRDNAFLIAAVSLPLVVVFFFLLSSAIPAWTVPAPAYDLLISTNDSYNQTNNRMTVEFAVRGGKVQATFRPVPQGVYLQRSKLFLFDHATMNVREIALELPDNLVEGDPPRTVVVDELAGREVQPQTRAPDGYHLENRGRRGPGIVGDVFGMYRYGSGAALVNRGRIIPIDLPGPYRNVYLSDVSSVGWLVDTGTR